jgi:chromatin segregation and condensation protein Rec8/ScpA/Scc1 (kleisin family)
LKEYIKQQKTRGFDIPSKELQEQILSELKECCEYNFDLSEQLLLWMYLTGLHGCYLLKEGDFVMFGLSAYRFSTQGDGD